MLRMIASQWKELQRQIKRQHSWILRALDTIKAEILATDVSVVGEEGTGSPKVSGLKFALFPLISVFFWTRHHWSFLSTPKAFRFYWVNFISLSLCIGMYKQNEIAYFKTIEKASYNFQVFQEWVFLWKVAE